MSGERTCRRGRLCVRGGRGLCFVRRGAVFVGGAWGTSDVVVCVIKISEKPVPALRRPPKPREMHGCSRNPLRQKNKSPRERISSEADPSWGKDEEYRDSNARVLHVPSLMRTLEFVQNELIERLSPTD